MRFVPLCNGIIVVIFFSLLVWTCRVAALATATYRHICEISKATPTTAPAPTETGVTPGHLVGAGGAAVTITAAAVETGTARPTIPATAAGTVQ